MKLTNKSLLSLAVLTLAMTSSSCASGPEGAAESAREERICINTRTARDFTNLSNRHVYVRAGRDGHYLLVMRHRCREPSQAYSMKIGSNTGQVCEGKLGEVIYTKRSDEKELGSCAIESIIRVDDRDHAIRIVGGQGAPPRNPGTWSDLPEPKKPKTGDK